MMNDAEFVTKPDKLRHFYVYLTVNNDVDAQSFWTRFKYKKKKKKLLINGMNQLHLSIVSDLLAKEGLSL